MDSFLMQAADEATLSILSFHSFTCLCAIRRTSKYMLRHTDVAFERVRAYNTYLREQCHKLNLSKLSYC